MTGELAAHPGLVAHLEQARELGFLGPGPVEPHIAHAQIFLDALDEVTGTVLDLGSGGGVPGLVIAVARPDLHLVLVDARAKRCAFLLRAAHDLAVDAEVVEGRAEVVGHASLRGTVDAVVARSFGLPAATAECGGPLLRLGGRLIVSEPPGPPAPGRWPDDGLDLLGLARMGRLGDGPSVQILEQRGPCPPQFPRRDGMPGHRPLF
ncbi:MAG: 16S rRNA (guanine(527)-N(7))-methyltransferase RsmG [Acidimicrobiales bacterium]